jgi:unsaturated chondroitin disaccharide hydrolase
MILKDLTMIKKLLPALFISMLMVGSSYAQKTTFKPDAKLLKTIDADYKKAVSQYKLMATKLQPDRFPKTYFAATDKFETSGSDWWCSGFYPGTLLYLYQQSKDPALFTEANRIMQVLDKEQYNTTTHDLGFMMYCSFGTALTVEPKPEYKQILINSAKSLVTRFDPKVGCIKSWDSKKSDYLVIIDNMMNLELLFWATKVTGDSSFYKIAVTHANTTIKNHFRPDYSSYHVVNYNPQTGEVQQRKTAQGFADSSAWARGQSWGLYGYTVMYRATKDKKYLAQANHIAQYILNNPNLPVDKIPYWDYDAPGKPNALRDASAAAVMASAFLELCRYADAKSAALYFRAAETIIKNLSGPKYFAAAGTNGGFILEHSVGSLPAKSEVDVPLTYADYYFIEALNRYKNFKHK